MAWSFGDSFDLYAAPADMLNGYWDTQVNSAISFVTGRFTNSRAFQSNASSTVVKSSAVNDAVHHLALAFQQTATITGSTLTFYLQLMDGATAQCSIVFRSDGAIVLQSGAPGGTTLATYMGAFSVVNTWYAYEFEVVINNTTGSFAVRKNGNNIADFTATSLNTRGGTANNYANKLQIGQYSNLSTGSPIDDLFWQSGAATGSWLGDIRCYTRMPASDQSVTFTKSQTSFFVQSSSSTGGNGSHSANSVRANAVVANATGTVTSLSINLSSGITGHMKMAVYSDSSGPNALLGSSVELTNPSAGASVTFTMTGSPVTVIRGTTYWIAYWSDAATTQNGSNAVTESSITLTYTTSFPSSMAGYSNSTPNGTGSGGMNITSFNAGLVSEAQQDGLTTYVYDSNPGDADFYGVASIGSTPATVVATVVRGYMQKSDVGTRTAAVQLKSGGTTVASPTLTLTTSGWQWAWRIDLTDPNTGAAWTAAAVNNAQIGPTVIA